ncbi:hypothetical protein [Moraxella sp. ZY210820]|uniref:hypothetical protein n=1 Tax=unclassified Moraxella TaxID=2685852 RepID=UPI002732009B|nr:hypothetical protein [Moraxella sp. ZY210820]WLF83641.1 hypothetical protein LU301_10355 [Moraxella sp. ZY210820]
MYMERFSFKQAIYLILVFSLYGGIVGGLIFALGMIPMMLFDVGFSIIGIGMILLLSVLFGWIFGFIPALITGLGIVIARNYFNIVELNKKVLFGFGFFITILLIILASLVITIFDGSLLYRIEDASIGDILSGVFGTLAFGGIGGLSSLILGKFVLPRITLTH